ncbi:hypothetical protein SAMN05518849_114133 [Sphingobium sp. AP50]|uniref:hypothetical protein n=1 Tax=Sphingobium sp. AP50 TaxID=1884369 RepID=UPI0008CF44B0|nr:hypothetical protein [Sphingobium sp. AP50]SEJ82171.1 hypothetical protein SAMN05518849_114133 [Sphingobium sp. AP50]
MSTRSQRYIIEPKSACPVHLRRSSGGPLGRVTLDIEEVARCAWNEILQTAPSGSTLFGLLEDLLEPGTDLVWRENGPGRGTEMRRSFSGLFGRFFARAYLAQHHDFVWFASIDGDNFHLSRNWRVSRKPRSKTEMPDWVCARPGELAIGEAKGSHQKGNATRGGVPGPIKTASGQITGIRVQKRQPPGSRVQWRSKRVKGWAVMSRWGLADPPRDPFLYALDPETEGDKPTPEEHDDLVQAVARVHVAQTAQGLGLLKMSDDGLIPVARSRMRIVTDEEKRSFSGSVISPFGLLDVDLDTARTLAASLPQPGLVRFVGLDEGVFQSYLEGSPIKPRERERIGDLSVLGRDGLIVAPIEQVINLNGQAEQS